MSTKQTPYDHSFRVYIGGSSKILVFHALIAKDNNDNFLIVPIPEFGIDDTYKSMFLEIIKGQFKASFTDIEQYKKGVVSTKDIQIDTGSAYKNLNEFVKLAKEYFKIDAEIKKTNFVEVLKFRFDGAPYHLQYGVPFREAGKLEDMSNMLVDVIVANNNNFGPVLQGLKLASSTSIPYLAEEYDLEAIGIVKKCILDINRKNIDKEFAMLDTKDSRVYKKFIEKIYEITKLKDLDKFEIYILGEVLAIEDIDYLRAAKKSLYENIRSGIGVMRYLHPHKNSRKVTLCLEVNGEDCSFHISATSDLYGDAYRLKIGDEVSFSASQIREKTYNLVTLDR